MNSISVIKRELRRLSRRPTTYSGRSALGAIAVLCLIVVSVGVDWKLIPAILPKGKLIFVTLAWALMGCCAIIGVSVTADCLSEERRDGTLGLLFLTPLRGFDILIGKFVSGSLNASYWILGILPVLAMSMLFGGVTFTDFFRLSLVLLNTLFLSIAAGLLVSSVAEDARKAVNAAFGIVLFFATAPYALWFWLRYKIPSLVGSEMTELLFLSPVYTVFKSGIFSSSPYRQEYFQLSLVGIHILGWLMILAGSFLLPYVFKRTAAPAGKPRKLLWIRNKSVEQKVQSAGRLAYRKKALDKNAYFWMCGRNPHKPTYALLFCISLFVIGLWAYFKARIAFPETIVFLLYFGSVFLKVWLVAETVVRIYQERRSGSFELLFTSPLGLEGVIQGLNRALVRQFGFCSLILAAIGLICYVTMDSWAQLRFAAEYQILFWPVVLVFLIDMWALKWCGIWSALKSRNSSRALGRPLGSLLVLPWLMMAATHLGVAVYDEGHSNAGISSSSVAWIWLLYCALVGLGFGFMARFLVLNRTRTLAMYGFDFASAERDWLGKSEEGSPIGKKGKLELLWPGTIRGRIGYCLLLLILGFSCGGQIRRIYHQRQTDKVMALMAKEGRRVPQLNDPNISWWHQFGDANISTELYKAISLSVNPQTVAGGHSLLTRLPSVGDAYSRARQIQVLKRALLPNRKALDAMLYGSSLVSLKGQGAVTQLNDWTKMQPIRSAFEVLSTEAYYRALLDDTEATHLALEKILLLSYRLLNGTSQNLRLNGARGLLKFQSMLAYLLSENSLSLKSLNRFDKFLAGMPIEKPMKDCFEVTWLMSVAYGNLDMSSLGLGRKDKEVIQTLRHYWFDYTGRNAKDWNQFLAKSIELLRTIELHSDEEEVFLATAKDVDDQSLQLRHDGFGYLASVGMLSNLQRELDGRARARLLRAILAVERYQAVRGLFPRSLEEVTDGGSNRWWIDPHTGKLFEYEINDDGYVIRSAGYGRTERGFGKPTFIRQNVLNELEWRRVKK